jgi:hypothetical protein
MTFGVEKVTMLFDTLVSWDDQKAKIIYRRGTAVSSFVSRNPVSPIVHLKGMMIHLLP